MFFFSYWIVSISYDNIVLAKLMDEMQERCQITTTKSDGARNIQMIRQQVNKPTVCPDYVRISLLVDPSAECRLRGGLHLTDLLYFKR